jgi:hypothetical protein
MFGSLSHCNLSCNRFGLFCLCLFYFEIEISKLTSLLGELGLNIQEAHAFSTNDGYSLDVFVVVGWHYEVLSLFLKEQFYYTSSLKILLASAV